MSINIAMAIPDAGARSLNAVREFSARFGDVNWLVCSDGPSNAEWTVPILPMADLTAWVAEFTDLPVAEIERRLAGTFLMKKILLAVYARRKLGWNYCVGADYDVAFFEQPAELVELAKAEVSFLISENGKADQEPGCDALLKFIFGYIPNYYPPPKGAGGYNAGLMGMDLSPLDRVTPEALLKIIATPLRWHDQPVLVGLTFTGRTPKLFKDERYQFTFWNASDYRRNSKAYHAIWISDKSCMDRFWSLKPPGKDMTEEQWQRYLNPGI